MYVFVQVRIIIIKEVERSSVFKHDKTNGLPVVVNPDKFRLNIKLCKEMLEASK